MLPSFARDTVTITEPVWVSERGKQTKTYPGPGVEVHGCDVQQGASDSDRAGRDNLQVAYTALLPPGTPVTRHARVTYEGEHFRVEGRPNRVKSPTGAVSHVSVLLMDWEG